ncbi:MAG TPA: CRISPR-associated endonuclease Cas2 [Chloroflexota bacterium]|nr:CRISPR-associated endonuclease Cas2 [Chloroflexota bacterium]
MGRCLVVYDIVEDRIRTKIADLCLDYGLSRIQYSAYLGNLNVAHQAELLQKAKRRLGRSAGHVAIFPICDADFKGRREVQTP